MFRYLNFAFNLLLFKYNLVITIDLAVTDKFLDTQLSLYLGFEDSLTRSQVTQQVNFGKIRTIVI